MFVALLLFVGAAINWWVAGSVFGPVLVLHLPASSSGTAFANVAAQIDADDRSESARRSGDIPGLAQAGEVLLGAH